MQRITLMISVSPVTEAKMVSRNAMYEQNMRDKGLKKVTLWIPIQSADDIKLMATICCENRDLVPSMLRSSTTGRVKGINQ